MSDRIAVMNQGNVDQVGTPREVYEDPATVFVADFLGVANLMEVEVVAREGSGCRLRVGSHELRAECGDLAASGTASAVVRPERLRVLPHAEAGENCIPGMVDRTVFVGSNLQVMVRLANGGLLQASVANEGADLAHHAQGQPVAVHVPAEALRILKPKG